MDGNTDVDVIAAGLAVRKPLCPGCNKRIVTAKQVGGISYLIQQVGTLRETTPYLVCTKCTPKIEIQTVFRRIDRRLQKSPGLYLFPIQWEGTQSPQNMRVLTGPEGVWVQDDEDWFKQNPTRTFRLRRAYKDESNTFPKPAVWIIVSKKDDPWRIRASIPFELPLKLVEQIEGNEATLWQLFEAAGGNSMAAEGGTA